MRLPSSRQGSHRPRLHIRGGPDRRRLGLRRRRLRHEPARSRASRSPAAPSAGGGARCSGARGYPSIFPRRQRHRRLCRCLVGRLRRPLLRRSVGRRRAHDDGQLAQHYRQPPVLQPRLAGPQLHGRRGLLVVAGGAEPGRRGHPRRDRRNGDRGRCQPAAVALFVRRLLTCLDAVAHGPLPAVRRSGGRLCAGRRRHRAGATFAGPGAQGVQPHFRHHRRLGRRPRRPHDRPIPALGGVAAATAGAGLRRLRH